MSKKITTKEFIEELTKVQRNSFTLLSEYCGREKKVMVRCNTCHKEYYMYPKSLLRGSGCKHCAFNKKLTTEQVQKELDNAYGYGIFIIKSEYLGNHEPLTIYCTKTGETFKKSRLRLLQGKNVPGNKIQIINEYKTKRIKTKKMPKNLPEI